MKCRTVRLESGDSSSYTTIFFWLNSRFPHGLNAWEIITLKAQRGRLLHIYVKDPNFVDRVSRRELENSPGTYIRCRGCGTACTQRNPEFYPVTISVPAHRSVCYVLSRVKILTSLTQLLPSPPSPFAFLIGHLPLASSSLVCPFVLTHLT